MSSVEASKEHIVEFRHAEGRDGIDQVRILLLEYAASLGIDLSFQDFKTELGSLPGKYAGPNGALLLAYVDGGTAGCVAVRKFSHDICEMKRLYVRDAYRGLGIGKRLVGAIAKEAKALGYRSMRLDTLSTMKEAQGLYESFGFRDIEPYVYNPIAGARFMELTL